MLRYYMRFLVTVTLWPLILPMTLFGCLFRYVNAVVVETAGDTIRVDCRWARMERESTGSMMTIKLPYKMYSLDEIDQWAERHMPGWEVVEAAPVEPETGWIC